MRKVLSFVLVLSLVLGSFGFAFAAPASDVAGTKYAEAVSVLTDLGVVSGYPDGTYKPANIVTRAEMAVIVVSALGLEDYAVGTAKFSDMAGHWSNGYVAYAASLGIIAGYPDGTFKPDATVSYDEAATMLVAALGYTSDSLVGTWPANYVTKAKTLGILDGIKSGAAGAIRGDIAIMAYQTLEETIGMTNKDGEFVPTNGDTMLNRLGQSLYNPAGGTTPTSAAIEFVLDNTDVVADGVNVKAYYGANVVAYANSDNEITAIKSVKSTLLTGDFDVAVSSVAAFSVGKQFDTAGDDYDVTATVSGAAVAYLMNGVAVSDYDVATTDTVSLWVKVSGITITDVYSVSKWDVTQGVDFVFEEADLDADDIYGVSFTLDTSKKIDLGTFELLGADTLADIADEDIVYVYTNAATNGKVSKIEVGTDVVKGTVTRIEGTTGTSREVTVNGTEYDFAAASGDSSDWNALALKDEVTFALDYAGEVYSITIDSSSMGNYGVILATEDSNPATISGGDAKVKLFLADGTTKIFSIDSDDVTTVSGLMATTPGSWDDGTTQTLNGYIVEYGVNTEGNIDAISLVTTTSNSAIKAFTSAGYFDSKIVKSTAVMFTYDGTTPAHKASADYYGVTTLTKLIGTEFAATKVNYHYDNTSNYIDVALITDYGTNANSVYGVITAYAQNSASSSNYMITFKDVDGNAADYAVSSTIYGTLSPASKYVLYGLTFDSAAVVTTLVTPTGDVAGDDSLVDLVVSGTIGSSGYYVDNVITISSTEYVIDNDATVWEWIDGAYSVVSLSRANLYDGDKVKLFDTNEDGVADFVQINSNF